MRRVLVAALILVMCLPATARGQEEEPPLEDVTLRGRVLHANGSPVANTALRVDAVNNSGFALFAFVFTLGLSSLSCFAGPSELCPVGNGERYHSTTDANGNYSFTFPDAHRRGVQTDTDYILSIGVPSKTGGDRAVVASYELELIDAVHSAPDLVMWDPAVKLTPRTRDYDVAYEPRQASKNSIQLLVADKSAPNDAMGNGDVDARGIEDAPFTVVPNAAKDVTAAGTIYHQRFVGAAVAGKGTLVPLSRGAGCTVARADGSQVPRCGYTDGDLIAPAVVDENPCAYDFEGKPQPSEDFFTGKPIPCQAAVREVTIDLGAAKDVGEVRARCSCSLSASLDGVKWWSLPGDGEFGAAQSMRFVRGSGESLGRVPEVSVWPPWAKGEGTPLAEGDRESAPQASNGDGDGEKSAAGPSFLLSLFAVVLLVEVARATAKKWHSDRSKYAT